MAFLDAGDISAPFALDPNRNDAVGAGLSALLPLAAVIIAQGVAAGFGVDARNLHYPGLPLAIPAPLASFAALLLFPLWGMARWTAWQAGRKGRAASWWPLALSGVALLYPYLSTVIDGFLLGWLDLCVLVLAAVTAARLAGASRTALWWMLPSVLFLALAAIPGYVVITGGWSPGLAITVVMANPER